jgi:hypothetical protein
MLGPISSLLRNLDGFENVVVEIHGSRAIFTELDYTGTKFFTSPIENALSSPFVIRATHYSQSDINHAIKWNILMEDVIRAGYLLLTDIRDLEYADDWQINALSDSQKIIASKGPNGIFEKSNGFSWIIENIKDELKLDLLVFRIGKSSNDNRIIARRDNYLIEEKGTEVIGYEGFIPSEEKFSRILMALQNMHKNWQHSSKYTHHHLFFWSNDDLNAFQNSFVQDVVRKYKGIVANESMYSSYGLIMCNLSSNNDLRKLRTKEKIALQRIRPGACIFIAPGTKPIDYQEIKAFISSIGIDGDFLLETKREMSIHECEVGIIDSPSIAIIVPIWAGFWKESRDIDGEQIIKINYL